MIRIVTAFAAAAVALLASSCCCTSDSKPPKLQPLPQFQEIAPVEPIIEATSDAPTGRGIVRSGAVTASFLRWADLWFVIRKVFPRPAPACPPPSRRHA
jgi:hypothetical protein